MARLEIVHLVAVRQINNFLFVVFLLRCRDQRWIGNHVIEVIRPHSARITEVIDLDRCRAARGNADAAVLREPLQINQDIDFCASYTTRYLFIIERSGINELRRKSFFRRCRISEASSGPIDIAVRSNFALSWHSNIPAMRYDVAC